MQRFAHQETTTRFLNNTARGFITSDPGTGKTLSCLDALQQAPGFTKALVLCPMTIMDLSWGADAYKFTDLSYSVAHGTPKKRIAALNSKSDVIITNHDAVNWIAENPKYLEQFSHLITDEFTAYKHSTTKRSKNLKVITNRIEHLWQLSGTPNSNTILDLWYPALLTDGGQRLGRSYWKFRAEACEPVQIGPSIKHIKWVDREGISELVADRLKDITIRFSLEECIDMPERVTTDLSLEMPPWVREAYDRFMHSAIIEANDGKITAINAGAKAIKALQILSGAVYDADGKVIRVHDERLKLIGDLVEARESCVIAFNYKHERDGIAQELHKRKISFKIIDGDTPQHLRNLAVNEFQDGEIQVLLCHPQTAAHGLTMTRGTTTIWASPCVRADYYIQLNNRIYRAGQTRRTETIRISYENSREQEVYQLLNDKLFRISDYLFTAENYSRAVA